ncbi:hypothetical protein SPYCW_1196 [Sphingopyxis sp. EG6]|nr:hypothetical protein SPYCW_1196 [Sphingopyxis sp. EG6]
MAPDKKHAFNGDRSAVHYRTGKENRWCPSTSFAGPPPRSGEDRHRPLPHPKPDALNPQSTNTLERAPYPAKPLSCETIS